MCGILRRHCKLWISCISANCRMLKFIPSITCVPGQATRFLLGCALYGSRYDFVPVSWGQVVLFGELSALVDSKHCCEPRKDESDRSIAWCKSSHQWLY